MRLRPALSGTGDAATDPAGAPATARPRTLIGGVGYRFQRDASFGLAVSDALADQGWPAHVRVEDLGYGAIHVLDDLSAAEPAWERLVLVAAPLRDRRPGGLYVRRWTPVDTPVDELQARIREVGGGVIDLDHLLAVGHYFGALPEEVFLIELEPADVDGGEGLSPLAGARLGEAVELARRIALAPAGASGVLHGGE